jgi:hypothetical protein
MLASELVCAEQIAEPLSAWAKARGTATNSRAEKSSAAMALGCAGSILFRNVFFLISGKIMLFQWILLNLFYHIKIITANLS